MAEKRKTALIREAIIQSIYDNSGHVDAAAIACKFSVSPQTIYANLKKLVENGIIKATAQTGRSRCYELVETTILNQSFPTKGLNEDIVFSHHLRSLSDTLPPIAFQAFAHVFLEMLNNAIDHSECDSVWVSVSETAYTIDGVIADKGVGIFSKIQKRMGLEEKKYAILELAKGKFTTDPESHTGEGIFFSSKIADTFIIKSDGLSFVGLNENSDRVPFLLDDPSSEPGTTVMFSIIKNRTRTTQMVFADYTEHPDDYGFNRTVVPVRLLEYGEKNPIFVSRSQARRLITRFERFKNVVLDYEGIEQIGQGFADEVYRVFQNANPDCLLLNVNTNDAVSQMILHVKSRSDEMR